MESDLASLADLVIIIVESPGSFEKKGIQGYATRILSQLDLHGCSMLTNLAGKMKIPGAGARNCQVPTT
jgi:hypothetical protein